MAGERKREEEGRGEGARTDRTLNKGLTHLPSGYERLNSGKGTILNAVGDMSLQN